MYNLAIRNCTSPPLLAPSLKIFKLKYTTPPGIEPRTCWTRGRHATIWGSAASRTEHCTDQNSSSAVPGQWPHTAHGQHISCRSSDGRCLIMIHLITQTSHPVISIYSYTSRNSCPVSISIFRMRERWRWVSQWFQSQATDFYLYKLFLKLGFVSVNSHRETYFVDAIHNYRSWPSSLESSHKNYSVSFGFNVVHNLI